MKNKFLCVSFDQELRSRRELVASVVQEPRQCGCPVNTVVAV